MGASGKWVIALIGLKKPEKDDHEKVGSANKSKKWKLWRSSSGDMEPSAWKKGFRGIRSDSSPLTADAFTAAVASVVRPKSFRVVRKEWAATRIQTAFRSLLARRALRALKGVVRLQALVRGRRVRKQAAVTLRCMQALVRVQARIRARRVRMSLEGQAVQKMLKEHRSRADHLKEAEEGWCDSRGTLEEVKAKLQLRQEGAFKRERAIAYSLAQKQLKSNQRNILLSSLKSSHGLDKNSWGWSWLERWMAAKPWENRLMEQVHHRSSETTPPPKSCTDYSSMLKCSKSSEASAEKVRKNNVTTRISARPPPIGQHTGSSSSPSSECQCDGSSGSSSTFTSATPVSLNTSLVSDSNARPNYMNLTQSTKAKLRKSNHLLNRLQRQSMEEFHFLNKSGAFSNADSKSSAGLDPPSFNFSKPLYPTTRLDKNSMRKKREDGFYD